MTQAEMSRALERLGIQNLHPWQEDPLSTILHGDSAFISAPTGGGKSLLYQVPAVIDEGRALTMVISPLRALQVDQVRQLQEKGVRAAILNSDLSESEKRSTLEQLPELSLLYLAPEQLPGKKLAKALSRCRVARLVVDEAHILPEAKLGFRKAYGKIGNFIDSLPERPQVIACTATATPKDRRQILEALRVPNAKVFTYPVRRENLHMQIKKIEGGGSVLLQALERVLKQWQQTSKQNERGSVIIYCPTVKGVKRTYKYLKARDWCVAKYTGKTPHKKRTETQQAFLSGDIPIIVATNAFGLGINKPDVRLIIHAGLPLTMSGYVQEIGRAGRDGKESRCVLFYTKGDYGRNKNILNQGSPEAAQRGIKGLDALRKLVRSKKCLWRGIERYFDEKPGKRCKICCRCKASK